jgi:quinol monooxygenase YgiN
MSEVVVIADVQAAPGTGDAVVEAFSAAIAGTHQEDGCVLYALHRDNADPDHFVHIEKYRSQADVDSHMAQAHTQAIFAWAAEPGRLARPPQLTFLTGLGIGTPEKGVLQGAGTPAG